MKSSENQHYYLDVLSNIPVCLFFFKFKKIWEASERHIFGEKYRFQKFYNYTRDFVQGTNGYYLNVSKDLSICCDSKMKNLLVEMRIDGDTGKFKNSAIQLQSCGQNNFKEINDLKSIRNLNGDENYSDLSAEVLSLFTPYKEKDCTKESSNNKHENLLEKLEVLISKSFSTSHFISIGNYKLESLVSTKFFEIFFRKYNISENNSVNDLLIYDIKELIKSKHKIFEESILKEKFLAKIIHEFKTPITSIIGLIGDIEYSLKSRNIEENDITHIQLNTIRNLSNYVIFLISDIITFANIKNIEQIKINSHEINLREIVNFCYDIMICLLKSSHSKEEAINPILEFQDEIHDLHIISDEFRLKQILLNLISNSVKFTKSGWIKIKCYIFAEKELVIVSVIDTGIGIKQNDQLNLLKEFYMINNDSIDNTTGSGLGLSISKNFATLMNIQFTVKSTYGIGSEFSLAIPFIPDMKSKESIANTMTSDVVGIHQLEKGDINQTQILQCKDQLTPTDLIFKRLHERNVIPDQILDKNSNGVNL